MPGAQVAFVAEGQPTRMAVQLARAGGNSATVVADQSGVATLQGMGGASAVCYYADGSIPRCERRAARPRPRFSPHATRRRRGPLSRAAASRRRRGRFAETARPPSPNRNIPGGVANFALLVVPRGRLERADAGAVVSFAAGARRRRWAVQEPTASGAAPVSVPTIRTAWRRWPRMLGSGVSLRRRRRSVQRLSPW